MPVDYWRVPYLCPRHCGRHRSGLFLRFIVGPKTKSEFEELFVPGPSDPNPLFESETDDDVGSDTSGEDD